MHIKYRAHQSNDWLVIFQKFRARLSYESFQSFYNLWNTHMKRSLFTALALLSLSACTNNGDISAPNILDSFGYFKEETAKRIAAPVFMIPRTIKANEFNIKSYERIYEEAQPTILYIGGNSRASGVTRTPEGANPVALRLAAHDPKSNVIYLAQVCQYVGHASDCPDEYTGDKRHAPEVIEAYNTALNNIRGFHDISGFHIVGYDGGAGIAAALAAQREDVLSLRTVAGILDTQFYAHINNTEFESGSLNPVDIASELSDMPQHHFIGQLDQKVPPAIYHSYAQAMGKTPCSQVTIVPDAGHIDGWAEQWGKLRVMPFTCDAPEHLDAVPFDPASLDKMGGPKGLSK